MVTSSPYLAAAPAHSGGSTRSRWLRRRWPLYLALAIVQGAYLGINAHIDNLSIETWEPFVWEYSSAFVIWALIPLVVILELRFPINSRPVGRMVVAHALGLLAFTTSVPDRSTWWPGSARFQPTRVSQNFGRQNFAMNTFD